jgi:hypothetical protein
VEAGSRQTRGLPHRTFCCTTRDPWPLGGCGGDDGEDGVGVGHHGQGNGGRGQPCSGRTPLPALSSGAFVPPADDAATTADRRSRKTINLDIVLCQMASHTAKWHDKRGSPDVYTWKMLWSRRSCSWTARQPRLPHPHQRHVLVFLYGRKEGSNSAKISFPNQRGNDQRQLLRSSSVLHALKTEIAVTKTLSGRRSSPYRVGQLPQLYWG